MGEGWGKKHSTSHPCVNSNTFRMNPTQPARRAHGRRHLRSIAKHRWRSPQKKRRAGATINPAATTSIIVITIYYSWLVDDFCHCCCWLLVLVGYSSINVDLLLWLICLLLVISPLLLIIVHQISYYCWLLLVISLWLLVIKHCPWLDRFITNHNYPTNTTWLIN